MTDITMPSVELDGHNWEPLGNTSYMYKGTIEGNGHTINGLVMNSAADYIGFVAFTSDATIKNLNLTNVSVSYSGNNYTNIGVIVGSAFNSDINGCTITGGLNCNGGNDVRIGGIVGKNEGINITDCHNKADITLGNSFTGTYRMGGIAGYVLNNNTNLSDCTNRGNLTGGSTTGTEALSAVL